MYFQKISENFSFYPLRPHVARLRRKTGPSEAGREAIRAGPEERGRGREQDFYELSIRRNIRVVQLIQFRKISDGLLPEQAFPEAEQPQRSTAYEEKYRSRRRFLTPITAGMPREAVIPDPCG